MTDRPGARDPDPRERFLTAIADRVNPESVAEAHLFTPIRQGGFESGVAVIAVADSRGGETQRSAAPDAEDAHARDAAERHETAVEDGEPEPPADAAMSADAELQRLVVYTARYRLTLKGPDRGKWDFAMHAEADAPLVTVDRVVRGVQHRSGDAEDPEKLSGEEFRARVQRDVAQAPPA